MGYPPGALRLCAHGGDFPVNPLLAFVIGFGLDLLFGDPHGFPHIVVGMGKLIDWLEHLLRGIFGGSKKGELAGGTILALLMCLFSFGATHVILGLLHMLHPLLSLAAESFLCWQCLALKSLKAESLPVYHAIKKGDLDAARKAVSMIVGRDTQRLSEAGVIRAAVETVAENTNDGVIAPMLFLALGGAPLGVMYKAINTMDSMVGYRNEKYLYFGRAAARLDDAANFLCARLAALLMVLAAFLTGLDGKNAWRIFLRDRYRHKSPNSAQTEAVCAGALHIRLGGDAYYFGKLVQKPTIGDDDRPVTPEDIKKSHRLLDAASLLCFGLCLCAKGAALWL